MIEWMKSLKARRNLLAWLVLAVCLLVTWLAWSALQAQRLQLAEREFNLRVDHMTDAIKERLFQNGQILLGGAGLFDASDGVSRAEWRDYIERLHLADRYPGIQGVGFSQMIPPASLSAHTAAVRAEGFSDYTVHPVGPRALYTSIIYLEPFVDRNKVALGFDMMSESVRATAMRRAVETGQTTISGKVTLVQDTYGRPQAGFLMYLPIYGKHLPLTTVAQRWAALTGFVYSPYRVDDLMRGILGRRLEALDFVIFDGPDETDAARLFATTEAHPAAQTRAQQPLTAARTLLIFGHSWVIRFQNDPAFESGVNSSDVVVPVLGGSISVLLFLLVSFLTNRREQAQELAEKMTLELRTLHAQRIQEAKEAAQTLRVTLYECDRHQQAVNAHAIVSVADTAGNITYVNDKFCEVSGYNRDALLGQDHRMLKSGAHSAEFYTHLWDTISRGKIWSGEICNRRSDGQLYWVESTIVPFMDNDGQPYQYISIRNDITQLKNSKEALRISTEHFRQGQEFANMGTWVWNIDAHTVFWSERIGPLLGYAPGLLESTFDNYVKAIHPEDRQAVLDAINACLQQNSPYDIEHRVVWPDGTVRWLLERGAVARNADGKAISMSGVVQDIHERKMTELALAESEARFTFAVEGAGDGIWDWSMLTGEMPLSGNYEGMLGYNKGELAPTIEVWTASVHPDDLARVLQELQDYLAGKAAVYAVELRLRCKDGSYKWVLCRGTVVARDEENQPVRMIGIHSDISVQKMLQTEMEEARETADHANQAKSDFLSSMSHELRTPMNAILGFAQLMQHDSSLSEDQQDNVHEIIKGGRHLLALINEVLDLGKIESGNLSLSLESVTLADVVEDCLRLIRPLAEASQIVLRGTVPPGAAVRADRMRLKQVLLNLLSNAVKYNRAGGSVSLDVQPGANQSLHITVADTGMGIATEDIAQLFEPFIRLGAEHHNIEGTGIGLTITRRLVHLMGGKIGVDSQLGIGSTFWIDLPSETMKALDAQKPVEVLVATPGSLATPRRVLCIDDNPANINLIAKLLNTQTHIELLTALSPGLGIELAWVHRPELILLDINMPDLNGYEVLQMIQADPYLKSIPVIAITANAMPHDIEHALAAGFTDYLSKPLDVDKFLSMVERYLSDSKEKTR